MYTRKHNKYDHDGIFNTIILTGKTSPLTVYFSFENY